MGLLKIIKSVLLTFLPLIVVSVITIMSVPELRKDTLDRFGVWVNEMLRWWNQQEPSCVKITVEHHHFGSGMLSVTLLVLILILEYCAHKEIVHPMIMNFFGIRKNGRKWPSYGSYEYLVQRSQALTHRMPSPTFEGSPFDVDKGIADPIFGERALTKNVAAVHELAKQNSGAGVETLQKTEPEPESKAASENGVGEVKTETADKIPLPLTVQEQNASENEMTPTPNQESGMSRAAAREALERMMAEANDQQMAMFQKVLTDTLKAVNDPIFAK